MGMHAESTGNSLLIAAAQQPDDDDVRLIYADWLDDHDDPRGQFIRLQLALGSPDTLKPQEIAEKHSRMLVLAKQEQTRWEEFFAMRGWKINRYELQRGLLNSFDMNADQFLAYGSDMVALTPVRNFRFALVDGKALSSLLDHPAFKHIRGLDLHVNDIGDDGATILGEHQNVGDLVHLNLEHNHLTPAGIYGMTSGHCNLHNLRELRLGNDLLADPTMDALAGSDLTLDTLTIINGGLTDDAMHILAGSRLLKHLRELDLVFGELTGAGAARLVNDPNVAGLQRLDLTTHFGISDAGAQAIAASPHLGALEDLQLFNCTIGDAGGMALAGTQNLPSLRVLNLANNIFGQESIQALRQTAKERGFIVDTAYYAPED